MMMRQRSEHRLRYVRRGEVKCRDGMLEALRATQHASEKAACSNESSFCLTFMKRQQAGRARRPLFSPRSIRKSERERERLPFELFMRLFNRPKRVLGRNRSQSSFVGIEERLSHQISDIDASGRGAVGVGRTEQQYMC